MSKLTLKQGIISAAAGLITGVAAGFVPMLLMILPAVTGYIGVAFGYGALGIALAASSGIIMAQSSSMGLASCIGYAAMLVCESIIIAVIFKKRGAYRTAAAYCAFAAALCQYGGSCLIPLIELGDPFAYYAEYAANFASVLVQSAAELGLDQAGLEQLEYVTALLKYSAPDIAVLSIVATSMISGLLSVFFANKLCKKFKTPAKPMASFCRWQLSRSFYRGALVLVIGALIISFSNIRNASAIMMALSCMVAGPYALMGLCFLVFSIKNRRKGRGILIASAVVMVVLLPYSIYGLCMMGVADRLFGMRRAQIK